MKLSKLAMATMLSVSIGFTPLLSTATSLKMSPAEISAQLRANDRAIADKMTQITVINESLNIVNGGGSSNTARVLYGMLAMMAIPGVGFGIQELDFRLQQAEIEKFKSLKEKAVQIGLETERILTGLHYIGYEEMSPSNRAFLLKSVDALVADLNQSEINAMATILTHSSDYKGRYFFREAVQAHPETKIAKALSRLQKRTGAIFKITIASLAAAAAAAGYTGFQAAFGDKSEFANVDNSILESVRSLTYEGKWLTGDKLNAWIEIQTLRSIELSAQIMNLESANQDLKNLEAALGIIN